MLWSVLQSTACQPVSLSTKGSLESGRREMKVKYVEGEGGALALLLLDREAGRARSGL